MTAFGMRPYLSLFAPGPFGEGSADYQLVLRSMLGSVLRDGGEITLPISPGARCRNLVREVRVRLLPSVPGTVHVHRPGIVLQVPRPMSDLVRRAGATQESPAAARGSPQLRAIIIDNARSLLCTTLPFVIPSKVIVRGCIASERVHRPKQGLLLTLRPGLFAQRYRGRLGGFGKKGRGPHGIGREASKG